MELVRIIIALLYAMPEILKFIRHSKEEESKTQLNEKVRQDFEKINKAFESKNPDELNKLFKS
jgi:hypothetical protein